MSKIKYTKRERERLGIGSNKIKNKKGYGSIVRRRHVDDDIDEEYEEEYEEDDDIDDLLYKRLRRRYDDDFDENIRRPRRLSHSREFENPRPYQYKEPKCKPIEDTSLSPAGFGLSFLIIVLIGIAIA